MTGRIFGSCRLFPNAPTLIVSLAETNRFAVNNKLKFIEIIHRDYFKKTSTTNWPIDRRTTSVKMYESPHFENASLFIAEREPNERCVYHSQYIINA